MKYRMKKTRKRRSVPGAVCLMALLLAVGACGCSRQMQAFDRTWIAMGTMVRQTVYGSSAQVAGELMDEITAVMEETEEQISWRLEDSQVSRINELAGAPQGIPVEERLAGDLQDLWQLSRESRGALDLTIAPVVRLWDIDTWAVTGQGTLPSESQIQERLRGTGYEQVTLEGGRIFLPEGYELDLGAVGKGMACDRILEVLMRQRLYSTGQAPCGAVISLGGSVLTYGSKPDGAAWRVGIVDPDRPDQYLGTLTLKGTHFISTSGDYERYVEVDGVRYHHIIDPTTGYPADSGVRSVTILCDSGMLGDGLSTACFVLGPERGLELAAAYEAEVLIVTADGELLMSDGMREVFQK